MLRRSPILLKTASMTSNIQPTSQRSLELKESLEEVRSMIINAMQPNTSSPNLVAVSKYKPTSDIQGCYAEGQRDFGENYVQELLEKAKELPIDIRWHFIGNLQSNKAKLIAAIPNLFAVHTVSSSKVADLLNKHLSEERNTPLNIFLQVNTSGEDSKSGVEPMDDTSSSLESSELDALASHILEQCPRLHLLGLMTIGSLSESLSREENDDFAKLIHTRDELERTLHDASRDGHKWGKESPSGPHLLLSMGMSSDFEVAIKAGSNVVRIGTGIFGERHKKGEHSA